jgi:hypothetical protein
MVRWHNVAGALLFASFLPGCGAEATQLAARDASTPRAPAAHPCALPAGDPLCAMNDAFRDAYAGRRAAVMATSGPVVVQVGDQLLLFRGKERLEGAATNARYHELKSVAHTPFAVYLMLAPVDGPLDEPLVQKLKRYRELVRRAASIVEGRFSEAAQRERQKRILSRTIALLDHAIDERRFTATELRDFVSRARADLLENMRDAVREQVVTMHTQVKAWSAGMTPEEMAKLRVVIGTVHMARPGNVAVQYFQAWLGEPPAGHLADERVSETARVIVGEGLFDAERLLALVGTHLVDRAAAAMFFDDPLRLDRDLFSDFAEAVVPEILGGEAKTSGER